MGLSKSECILSEVQGTFPKTAMLCLKEINAHTDFACFQDTKNNKNTGSSKCRKKTTFIFHIRKTGMK